MKQFFLLALLPGLLVGAALAASPGNPPEPIVLAPVDAVGIQVDTLLLGGYARGDFSEAVAPLGSDLSEEERALIAGHLERIFGDVLGVNGLGSNGRLLVAYERASRPDGTPRSVRILSAEVALGGRVHTAYYFEREGKPGYFDAFGRSLDGGEWLGPLPSIRATSQFGDRRMHPILGRVLPHTGVDLAARAGEPIRATDDGVVSIAGEQGGYGLLVEIRHPNGYSTRYAHMSALGSNVATGRSVRRGDVIGLVGSSGLATGPHLHYEVRLRGQPLDPMRLMGARGFGREVVSDPGWAEERRRLGALLAEAPRAVQARGRP